jgi:hypothetical protein
VHLRAKVTKSFHFFALLAQKNGKEMGKIGTKWEKLFSKSALIAL